MPATVRITIVPFRYALWEKELGVAWRVVVGIVLVVVDVGCRTIMWGGVYLGMWVW